MTERNHTFDFLCGLCILRVVTLHTLNFCGHASDAWWEVVMRWSWFLMSFFFFKAGFFNKGLSGPTGPYLADRAKRLMVPYLSFALIGNLVYFAFVPRQLELYHKTIEPLEWSYVWEHAGAVGNPPEWFLVSFFMAYVVAHFIDRWRWARWLVVGFPLLSYWGYASGHNLWMNLANVPMGVAFFYLGRMWRWTISILSPKLILIMSLGLVSLYVGISISSEVHYSMSSNTFTGNPLLVVVASAAVVCGLSGVCQAVRLPRVPVVAFIGEHSMVYFLLHYPILYYYKFMHLAWKRSIYNASRWDDFLILLPLIFAVCTWLVPYVERCSWLSGRWRKR